MNNPDLLAQLRTQFASVHWPGVDDVNHSENHYVIDITIGSDMHWLEGHFPQQPVVAGVVQTHWAGEFSKHVFNLGDEFIRIDNLKFQQVILPGQSLQLTLDYSVATDSRAVKFRYLQGETIFSEGKLVFNNPASPAQ